MTLAKEPDGCLVSGHGFSRRQGCRKIFRSCLERSTAWRRYTFYNSLPTRAGRNHHFRPDSKLPLQRLAPTCAPFTEAAERHPPRGFREALQNPASGIAVIAELKKGIALQGTRSNNFPCLRPGTRTRGRWRLGALPLPTSSTFKARCRTWSSPRKQRPFPACARTSWLTSFRSSKPARSSGRNPADRRRPE